MMNRLRALWRDRKGTILGLSAVLGICLLRFALGLPCPIQHLTGISCPGCGMTRGLWELVTLDFAAAWHFHPAAFALPPVCLLWLICHLKGWNKAASATLIAFAILLVCVYILRLMGGNGSVVTISPENGLIGRVLNRLFSH